MFSFFKKFKSSPETVLPSFEVATIPVSAEIMDKSFSRAAGRDCSICGFHGSHHTDKHNEFAIKALSLSESS